MGGQGGALLLPHPVYLRTDFFENIRLAIIINFPLMLSAPLFVLCFPHFTVRPLVIAFR